MERLAEIIAQQQSQLLDKDRVIAEKDAQITHLMERLEEKNDMIIRLQQRTGAPRHDGGAAGASSSRDKRHGGSHGERGGSSSGSLPPTCDYGVSCRKELCTRGHEHGYCSAHRMHCDAPRQYSLGGGYYASCSPFPDLQRYVSQLLVELGPSPLPANISKVFAHLVAGRTTHTFESFYQYRGMRWLLLPGPRSDIMSLLCSIFEHPRGSEMWRSTLAKVDEDSLAYIACIWPIVDGIVTQWRSVKSAWRRGQKIPPSVTGVARSDSVEAIRRGESMLLAYSNPVKPWILP